MLDPSTLLLMILIPAIIWGGLIYFVHRAYQREKKPTSDA